MKWYEKHQYALAGAIVGLLIAVPILWLGFFKTLLLIGFIAVGAFVGKQFEGSGILEKWVALLKNKY